MPLKYSHKVTKLTKHLIDANHRKLPKLLNYCELPNITKLHLPAQTIFQRTLAVHVNIVKLPLGFPLHCSFESFSALST